MLNHRKCHGKLHQGFFLIEVLIAAAVISGSLILLLGSIQNSVEVAQRSLERTQASFLLTGGAEAVKSIRDQSWTSISTLTSGTTYYLQWSGSAWTLSSSTPETIGVFSRSVVVNSVSRDASDDITTSGGTVDAGTKKVTVTVSWAPPTGAKTETLSFYMSNIQN